MRFYNRSDKINCDDFDFLNNYKSLMLRDLMSEDTNELDNLISEYNIVKQLIKFSEISDNTILLNKEIDIILNNYIVDNNIDEDCDYQNLHNYKNLKSSDLCYLHNKYIPNKNKNNYLSATLGAVSACLFILIIW